MDGEIQVADDDNTSLIQVSVARVVKGYLSRLATPVALASWSSPDKTPETIREIAAKLIASQLYVQQNARTSLTIEERAYAQWLYDRAIEMLNQVIAGDIIVDPTFTPTESLSDLDYFPVDATDRAFSVGMRLYGQRN